MADDCIFCKIADKTMPSDIVYEDEELVGHMFLVAASLSREQQIAQNGFRLVTNCNKDGGQTVFHLHMHLLGGRSLHWPPG